MPAPRLPLSRRHRRGPRSEAAFARRVALALIWPVGCCARRLRDDQDRARRSGPAPRPLGDWNRKVFAFNEGLDEHAAQAGRDRLCRRRPAAAFATASATSSAISRDAWSAVNNILQGKVARRLRGRHARRHEHLVRLVRRGRRRVRDGARPPVRGFRPDARHLGIRRRRVLVLPLLGPSSVRDAAALAARPARLAGAR